MNISSRDNAVPVFLLRNCAGHLPGPLRTIGAVAVGHLGTSASASVAVWEEGLARAPVQPEVLSHSEDTAGGSQGGARTGGKGWGLHPARELSPTLNEVSSPHCI